MDIFAAYATDDTKEKDGIWVEIGDSEFLIARAGNPNYVKKLSRSFERNQKFLERKDEAAEKLSEKLLVEVIADTILLDWKNVQFKGEEFPHNRDNAIALLNIKDFRKQVMQHADDFAAYKAVQEGDQEKN